MKVSSMRSELRRLSVVIAAGVVICLTIGMSLVAEPGQKALAAASANDLALAMGLSSADIVSATLGTSDPAGVEVLTSPAAGFPTEGDSYAVLSSGRAADALSAGQDGFASRALAGLNTNQGTDLVQLTLVLNVPSGATTISFDWRFFSEEFPEYVGTGFNDAFLAEKGSSTFTVSGSTINAPNNVAFDQNGNLITINTSGALGMTAANGAGTIYDGATPTLTTTTSIPAETTQITLIFSVFDVGDSIFDTAVFLDNVHYDVGGDGGSTTKQASSLTCTSPASATEGDTIDVSATLKDATTLAAISGGNIDFSVLPGGPTATETTDTDGVASTSLSLTGLPPGSYTVKAFFSGSETYQQSSCEKPLTIEETPTPSDTTPPVITVPGNIVLYTTSLSGTTASFTTTFEDPDSGLDGTEGCTPASGSTFATGETTTVNCTATNNAGLTDTKSFTVTVIGFIADPIDPKKFGIPSAISGHTLGPIDPATYKVKIDFGDGSANDLLALSAVPSGDPPQYTWSTTHTYSSAGTFTVTESLVKADDTNTALVTDTRAAEGLRHDTEIVMLELIGSEYQDNIMRIRSQLLDKDKVDADGNPVTLNNGISGKTLSVTTDPSSSVPSKTTVGIQISAPSEIAIQHCETMPFDGSGSIKDCARDENQPEGDNSNEVVRVPIGGKFSFANDDNKQVNLFVTGVGSARVTLIFKDADNPSNTFTEAYIVEEGGYTISGYQIPSGVGEVEIGEIEQLDGTTNPVPGTVGISRIMTFNANGGPATLFDNDFETYSAVNSLGTSASVSDGSAFVLVTMPDSNLIVTEEFAGDDNYNPSSQFQVIELRPTDIDANSVISNPTSDSGSSISTFGGAASELTSNTVSFSGTATSDSGLSSRFVYKGAASDKDKDGISDTDETNFYITTSAGKFYICPGVTSASTNKNPCGLNPLHKNFFVEVDSYVGRAPTAEDKTALTAAMANLNVENPDKTKGITLTMQVDDILTPAQGFPAVMHAWIDTDTNNKNDYDNVFQIRAGTGAERGSIPLFKDNALLTEGKFQIYHHMLIVPVLGTGTTIDCTNAASGVSEDPPGNQHIVALGCSDDGPADPNYPGTNLGNKWQFRGITLHEWGHQIGLHHNGPVKAQNLWAVTLNAALTQTSASTGGTPAASEPTNNIVRFSGGTISTTGKYEGYYTRGATLTLSGASTVTPGTATKSTAPAASLNMDTPQCMITSGAGLSSQTLTCYWSIRTGASVSGLSPGVWDLPVTLTGGASVSSVAPKSGSTAMTNNIPSKIYAANCMANHPSVTSYALQTPELIDKSSYFLSGGTTFNTAYTPVNWNKIYTHPYTGGFYPTLDEKKLNEDAGEKEGYYTTAQKIVYGYAGSGGARLAGIGSTYPSVPAWIDFNGNSAHDTNIAADINHLGIAGCTATAGQLATGTLAETKHINLIWGVSGGLVDSRSGHADVSTGVSEAIETIATSTTGFLPPVNQVGEMSQFKAGSTIPLKLVYRENQVIVPDLTEITHKAVFINNVPNCGTTEFPPCELEASDSSTPSSGTTYRWDPEAQQYIYNWGTKGKAAGTYHISALYKGVVIAEVDIALKK